MKKRHTYSVACHFERACDGKIRSFPAKGDGFLSSFEMTGELLYRYEEAKKEGQNMSCAVCVKRLSMRNL